MAKKKQNKETKLVTADTEGSVYLDITNEPVVGKGVGVYYDASLKKYVLVTLDLTTISANIIEKKVLKSSKLTAILEADIKLKQLLEREVK